MAFVEGCKIMANAETNIEREILIALSEAGILAWKQHVGTYRALHSNHVIDIGIKGMADIGCIVPVNSVGLAVQIEVKTETGKQQPAQKTWEQAVNNRGGVYMIARSADDALAQIAALKLTGEKA